jgi:hypothetical protein
LTGEHLLLARDSTEQILGIAPDLEPALIEVTRQLCPPLTRYVPSTEKAVIQSLMQFESPLDPSLCGWVPLQRGDGDSGRRLCE